MIVLVVRRSGSRALRPLNRRPPAARVAGLAFAASLVVLGVGGTLFQLALPSLLPSPLDWRAAAEVLERDARPRDAVLASPAWAERIRMVAPRGLRVLSRPSFAAVDLEGVRRIWLVSLLSAPGFSWKPEVELLAHASAPDAPLRIGQLQLARFEITHPDLPLASLAERLQTAAVTMADVPCSREGGVFQCSSDRARASLENTVIEVGGLPRPCLLARAWGSTVPLAMTFPGVPMGRVLRGTAGTVDGSGAPIPITMAMRVDGEEVGVVQLDPAGRPIYRLDTSRWAGEKHAVSLEVVVPEDRELCLQAVTLP